MEDQADAPPPIDADEPPPRKRGLGAGLADLAHAGQTIGTDGQPYYSLDSLMWAIDRAHARRAAERTPQPKALHRLPEPSVDTGQFRVADIIGAPTDAAEKPATVAVAPAPEVPKPRRLSESAALLVRGLPGMSEALRAADPATVTTAPAPLEPAPSQPARGGKFAWLADDDED